LKLIKRANKILNDRVRRDSAWKPKRTAANVWFYMAIHYSLTHVSEGVKSVVCLREKNGEGGDCYVLDGKKRSGVVYLKKFLVSSEHLLWVTKLKKKSKPVVVDKSGTSRFEGRKRGPEKLGGGCCSAAQRSRADGGGVVRRKKGGSCGGVEKTRQSKRKVTAGKGGIVFLGSWVGLSCRI